MTPDGKRDRTAPQVEEFAQDAEQFKLALRKSTIDSFSKDIAQYKTYYLDHIEQVYQIKVRSLAGVQPSVLENLIQTKFEVVELKEIDTNFVSVPCKE